MADTPKATKTQAGSSTELNAGAIGAPQLVFLVLAAAAPLAASATNIPLIIGLGNGIAAPADFLFIGVLLILFSVGFTAMSTHVSNAGAFYTYISMGLGARLGTGAGYMAVFAYNLLSVYSAAAASYFATDIIGLGLGIEIPWWICAIVLFAIVYLLSYFGVKGGTAFLAICLTCEVTILAALSIATFVRLGPSAYTLDCFNPAVFMNGAPGLGVTFAFLCFIGFEATAIYSEEAKNPRKTVPRATYIAVIVVAIIYMLSAWSAIAATGAEQVVIDAKGSQADDIFYHAVDNMLNPVVAHIYNWFLLLSALATWVAIHGMASRYLFAFGRAGLLPKQLAITQRKYKTPYIASFVNVCFVTFFLVLTAVFGLDPYKQLSAISSAIAVFGVMVLELLVSLAVFFYMRKHRGEEGFEYNAFTRIIAPLVSFAGLLLIAVMACENFNLLTGTNDLVINIGGPATIVVAFLIGLVYAIHRSRTKTLPDPADINASKID